MKSLSAWQVRLIKSRFSTSDIGFAIKVIITSASAGSGMVVCASPNKHFIYLCPKAKQLRGQRITINLIKQGRSKVLVQEGEPLYEAIISNACNSL